jgi:C-terminal processing protease CtpA/Prc
LVLDVRDCVGGAPATVALICSYLLGPEPVHLIDIESAAGREQSWSHAWVPGRRFGPDRPVAVLTSARTFSGGEELAFDLQELGRAVLVGERTRGGAHPRVGVRVHSHLEVTVPCARAVSPRTDTNWEGVGVTPDLEVPEGQALDAALRRLSERLC